MYRSRSPRRASLAAALSMTTVLLAPLATGCGLAEGTRAADSSNAADSVSDSGSAALVRDAVHKLLEQKSATLVAEFGGSAERVEEFLRESRLGLPGGGEATGKDAELLARAQLTLSVGGQGQPLNELPDFSDTHLAGALNLGDRDLVAYKSIDGNTYLRLLVDELAEEKTLPSEWRRLLRDLSATASQLPDSLSAVKRLLTGDWVSADPGSYEQFAWVVRKLTGSTTAGDQSRTAASALDSDAQRRLLDGLLKLLTEDGDFERIGGAGGSSGGDADGDSGDRSRDRSAERGHTAGRAGEETQRVRMTVSARDAARRLAPALEPLGMRVEPAEVPDRTVPAEVTVRRGVLVGLTVDARDLTGSGAGGSGAAERLPLRFGFGSGDALSVEVPEEALRLEPQDVLAALLYRKVPGLTGG
ncbi:hypothetical protein [Streptomyces oceani]|nr:hypothetical protein [Streptomyces oceani]